jgi:glycerol-3-phosphate dehydrogenase (NAD(P)+)
MTSESVAVIGIGNWGIALTKLLVRNCHSVRLWGSRPGQRARLLRERDNKMAHAAIAIEADMDVLRREASQFLIAVPSRSFRAVLRELRPAKHVTVGPDCKCAAVSGPTFASEITRGLPGALTVASRRHAVASMVAGWFRNDRMMVHTSRDVVGVQIGGATKNVIAIAAGISDGLGFGANARAALITRGLDEVMRLGIAMGGQPETFHGFAGIGDLVLTCTDDSSRNRRVGLGLGRGERLGAILAQIGQETEGVAAARELHHLARRYRIEMPIVEQVYRVLYEDASPRVSIETLFRSRPRRELLPAGPQVLPLLA